MRKPGINARGMVITLMLTISLAVYVRGGGPPHPGDYNLETLTLVLELTPDQVKQATEILKAGQTAKSELLDRLREQFEGINELVRSDAPKDSEIKAIAHEIAALQEQLIIRDAQMQVAFRKILRPQQVEKLNRLEHVFPGGPGPRGPRGGPGGGPPFRGKAH